MFYYRSGTEVTGNVQARNRSYYVVQPHPCGRCGGQGGAEQWKFTGFTCYECNGSGFLGRTRDVTVYTAEALAKLETRAVAKARAHAAAEKARDAAFEAAYAELLAKVNQLNDVSGFINDVIQKGYKYGTLSDAQVAAVTKAVDRELEKQNAPKVESGWVGTVGDRATFNVTVLFVTFYEGTFGKVYIHGMKDDAGNVIIHKGSALLVDIIDGYPRQIRKGEHVSFSATVKEHGTREGVKQTIVARPSRADFLE